LLEHGAHELRVGSSFLVVFSLAYESGGKSGLLCEFFFSRLVFSEFFGAIFQNKHSSLELMAIFFTVELDHQLIMLAAARFALQNRT
jgi:hypothetical protein